MTSKYNAIEGSMRKVADRVLQGMRCSIGRTMCICAGFSTRQLPASVLWRYNQGGSVVEGGHLGVIRHTTFYGLILTDLSGLYQLYVIRHEERDLVIRQKILCILYSSFSLNVQPEDGLFRRRNKQLAFLLLPS